jgi:glycerol kinase
MAKQYIMAIDQGTTSSRTIIFDHSGRIVCSAQQEFTQHFPQPGWVEHDAAEIWAAQEKTIGQALRRGKIKGSQIAAIGITNQRETTVLWDRATGEPVCPAIVWQCRRTAPICDKLKKDGLEKIVRSHTGLVVDAYFSGTKIKWMLDNHKGLRKKAEAGKLCFGTIDSWLVYKLSGGQTHKIEVSNASRTMIFDIKKLQWDKDILKALNIPEAVLPEVCESSGAIAVTSGVRGLPDGIPVAGIAGDQQAALFGQACYAQGAGKCTYGTGAFLLMNTGDKPVASNSGLLTTVAWTIGGKTTYALEGSVFICGAVIQWLRDGMDFFKDAKQSEALATSVPDSGGVYLVPAFVGLGAPHWDMYARGAMLGLTRGTTRAHVTRAALESMAFQVTDLVRAMQADSGIKPRFLNVDGGAAANNFLMQFQADVLGAPVDRPKIIETTGLGAAFLAGLGVGYWSGVKELAAARETQALFKPAMKPADRARLMNGWHKAVDRAKNWEDA